MYINITHSETGGNKGSCGALVHYLDKENRLGDREVEERWFHGQSSGIPSYEVKSRIDSNVAKLGKDEAKFFLVNISPSKKELAYLADQHGIDTKKALKAYAIEVMNEYARNFKRPGVESNNDLLWFGKVEQHRYYSYRDPEVKQGTRKRGERKAGNQTHVQVIVSRKDATNKIKLSPMNNSRGLNAGHSQKVGQFDRSAFKASGERIFDECFGFERGLTETFSYANTQKNGSLDERLGMQREVNRLDKGYSQSMHINKQHHSLGIDSQSNFLSSFVTNKDYELGQTSDGKRKKKKTRQNRSKGLGR